MWRSRVGALLLVVVAIVTVKVGQEAYRWHAFEGEREQIREMTVRLEEHGYQVIRTHLRVDSLRASIERSDAALDSARRTLDAYERRATLGRLDPEASRRYREELDVFNAAVSERNTRMYEWESALGENHEVVARYNRLADSVRAVAARMGDPYYDVPAPVEMAARRGLIAPSPR
jgi:hypothetical protein